MFAAIYHPVGMSMLIEASKARGRTLAFNGVCGNMGVALAAGITALIASFLGWRAAFFIPGAICIVTGFVYLWAVADRQQGQGAAQVSSGGAAVAQRDLRACSGCSSSSRSVRGSPST